MNRGNRNVRVHMLLSEQEANIIRERMAELGIVNQSLYFRKMAIDGYIIHLDMTEIRELTRLLSICSNNLNQYAHKANATGKVYQEDIEQLKKQHEEIWEVMNSVLMRLSNI